MSRLKLPIFALLITLSAFEVFSQFGHWYSPFVAALIVIVLTALVQKSEPSDEL